MREDSEIRKAIERFDELSHAADAVQAELNALDASERALWDAWAKSPNKSAPTINSARRADIHKRLEQARAAAAAGQRGAVEMRSRLAEHGRHIAQTEKEIAAAIPEVLFSEYVDASIDAVKSAGIAMATEIARLTQLRNTLFAASRGNVELTLRCEQLDRDIRVALQQPDDVALNESAYAGWMSLASRLKSDARAAYEDAPAALDLDQLMRKRAEALQRAA